MKIIYNFFQEAPELEFGEYRLRLITNKDDGDIYNIYSDQEAIRFEGINIMSSLEEAQNYIKLMLKGYKNKYFIRWALEDKRTKVVIGLIALHHIDYRNFSAQLGYILNKKHWNRNIMSSILEQFVDYLFGSTELHRIELSIHPDNKASVRVAEKLGFHKEGLQIESAYNSASQAFEDRLIYARVNKK